VYVYVYSSQSVDWQRFSRLSQSMVRQVSRSHAQRLTPGTIRNVYKLKALEMTKFCTRHAVCGQFVIAAPKRPFWCEYWLCALECFLSYMEPRTKISSGPYLVVYGSTLLAISRQSMALYYRSWSWMPLLPLS